MWGQATLDAGPGGGMEASPGTLALFRDWGPGMLGGVWRANFRLRAGARDS